MELGKDTGAPFFVGIVSDVPLDSDSDRKELRDQLKKLFDFLQYGCELTRPVVEQFGLDPNSERFSHYLNALNDWTGLEHVPIVVMADLTQDSGRVAAKLVLDEFSSRNVTVRCPLPFPPDLCQLPDPGRQAEFHQIFEMMGHLPAVLAARADMESGRGISDPSMVALRNDVANFAFPVCTKADLQHSHINSAEPKAAKRRRIRWYDEVTNDEQPDIVEMKKRRFAPREFMSITVHLLVTVSRAGHDLDVEYGTRGLVKSRHEGPHTEVLPTTSMLSMPNGGLVCQINLSVPVGQPRLELQVPHRPEGDHGNPANGHADPNAARDEWIFDRLRLFARMGDSLRRFHQTAVPSSLQCYGTWRDLIEPQQKEVPAAEVAADGRLTDIRQLLYANAHGKVMADHLKQVVAPMTHAENISAVCQARVRWILFLVIMMTLAAAVCLHIFAHCHPRHVEHAETAVAGHAAAPAEVTSKSRHHNEQLSRSQTVFGWWALGFAVAALSAFAIQRYLRFEERGYDARAIAEGLRIQFYWNLAGLGDSVAANYMSRHRSELDWIRSVVRAASIPYHRWAEWFDELPVSLQRDTLKVIHWKWVKGQFAYFRREWHRRHEQAHRWHIAASVLALAGVATFLRLLLLSTNLLSEAAIRNGGIACLMLTTAFALFSLIMRLSADDAAKFFKPITEFFNGKTPTPRPTGEVKMDLDPAPVDDRSNARYAWDTLRAIVHKAENLTISWTILRILQLINLPVIRIGHSATEQTRTINHFKSGLAAFMVHIPIAISVSYLVTLACIYLSKLNTTGPDLVALEMTAGGVLLLGGAMCMAWAEKRLHSEFAYQYNTMAGLFHAVDGRLQKELQDLDALIHRAADPAEVRKKIEHIQALLKELGQEALDENAEWLLLHRARPLEPLLPG